MWVLICGSSATMNREGGVHEALDQLGCPVQTLDIWDVAEHPGFASNPPAALIVDAGRAGDAARAALSTLRQAPGLGGVPALVALEVDGLQRLDANDGFDDFVLTPILPAELYTRLRRVEWRRSEFESRERLKVGPLLIDLTSHEVSVGGQPVALTFQEFQLLVHLAKGRGRVFRRDELLGALWQGERGSETRTVDIHVRRLRAKLGSAAAALQTVRGVGYKLKSS